MSQVVSIKCQATVFIRLLPQTYAVQHPNSQMGARLPASGRNSQLHVQLVFDPSNSLHHRMDLGDQGWSTEGASPIKLRQRQSKANAFLSRATLGTTFRRKPRLYSPKKNTARCLPNKLVLHKSRAKPGPSHFDFVRELMAWPKRFVVVLNPLQGAHACDSFSIAATCWISKIPY